MLSSAKDTISLFQKADGLQAIRVYRAGEQNVPAHVKGQSCRTEGQRKGELFVCLQAKLSFSCTTILVRLFFYPSSSGNMKCSPCEKDSCCVSQSRGRSNGRRRAETEMCAVSLAHG